nr:winged helix-turn-helix domain-containing protein [Budvicia diplopodorum]
MQQDELSATILSNSSNRLLYELLCNYGQTVSRDTLFQNVWDNHGLVSSNSNLNHYISQLRKALISFGLSDKVIITVPKIGFKFSEEIPVMLLDNDGKTPRVEGVKELSISIDKELDGLTRTVLSETHDRNELVVSSQKPDLSVVQHDANHNTANREKQAKKSRKLFYIVSLAAVLGGLIAASLFFTLGKKENQKHSFLFVATTCPIYIFYSISEYAKGTLEKEIETVIRENNISCEHGQFIMVNYVNETVTSLCSAVEERSFSCSVINS